MDNPAIITPTAISKSCCVPINHLKVFEANNRLMAEELEKIKSIHNTPGYDINKICLLQVKILDV